MKIRILGTWGTTLCTKTEKEPRHGPLVYHAVSAVKFNVNHSSLPCMMEHMQYKYTCETLRCCDHGAP